ncbi:MAG: FAD-dependent oxidoreductase [Clostridium sp.]|nr:FAD-dependent oxidoreductase [Clostridium sp.]MCM1398848.1 FAD-dependent oxidoreductase [Clostridium sp.]MCM1458521.1 FAD-binding protein [Bacteroides sp.]
MLTINQVKVPVEADQAAIHKKIAHMLGTSNFKINRITKKSIDARKKNEIYYIYSFEVSCEQEAQIVRHNSNNNNIMSTEEKKYTFPYTATQKNELKPVIVGAGPAGYFCGLYLARAGYEPIILERGRQVEQRTKDVNKFWNEGILNPESNVSFGEGGAGTFSDGKLNTGIKDREGRIKAVINDFIACGAPEDIGYLSKPHIGTDHLFHVVANMRREIEAVGGRVCFETCFTGFEKNGGRIKALARITGADGEKETVTFDTKSLVLAIGHSARDTFAGLHQLNVCMEPKAFAMGVRVEHLRSLIDESQYGSRYKEVLPAADYKMTYRSSSGRSVYSFCMCPGGFVVNASSDVGQSVVNGMSNHSRDGENSNSAIVVNVTPDDFREDGFDKYGVLAGVEFQKKYEALAYQEGKRGIPIQLFGDYKAGKVSADIGHVTPNIKGAYCFGNLNNCLPPYVNNAIIEGIEYYGNKLRGFSGYDTVLSGIETRTSSPVRILRDENFMSISTAGIFPCGEGAGYAGGITSAAVDGIKVAEAVARYLNEM